MKRGKRMGIAVLLVAVVGALPGVAVLYYQGRQRPDTSAEYVALGSSFAAGLGLGPRVPGSPIICQRSINGYPQQLARMTGLRLSDMSCSGATVSHVMRGGQMFQGPQIDALGPATRLVTLTAGGNDIAYVGDLTALAYWQRGGLAGFLTGLFWSGAQSVAERNFVALRADLLATLREIGQRSPKARIFVVTYPLILPPEGTCPELGISAADAERMRPVGLRLAELTREVAKEAGATVIDMERLSSNHDACTSEPWVNGATPKQGAPFHPTLAGARAAAEMIKRAFEEAD